MKKEWNFLRSFAKEQNVLAFFPILYKRTGRSLRSFPFFAKERNVLYVLSRSFEKNRKERSNLLGLISRQKLKKRTGKNGTFFKWAGHSERERTRCPTLTTLHYRSVISLAENLAPVRWRDGHGFAQFVYKCPNVKPFWSLSFCLKKSLIVTSLKQVSVQRKDGVKKTNPMDRILCIFCVWTWVRFRCSWVVLYGIPRLYVQLLCTKICTQNKRKQYNIIALY